MRNKYNVLGMVVVVAALPNLATRAARIATRSRLSSHGPRASPDAPAQFGKTVATAAVARKGGCAGAEDCTLLGRHTETTQVFKLALCQRISLSPGKAQSTCKGTFGRVVAGLSLVEE